MIRRSEYDSRRKRLFEFLDVKGRSILVISGAPNITYLTGIREPSGVLLVSEDCGDTLITSILDYHRILSQCPSQVEVVAIGRSGEESLKTDIIPRIYQGSLSKYIADLARECNVDNILFDLQWSPQNVWRIYEDLRKENLNVGDASDGIARARALKTPEEIDVILKAIEVAEKALAKLVSEFSYGITEAEGAAIVYGELMKRNSWGPSFPTIVAFHDNTAYPHHTPSPRVLGHSGPVLVDLGAIVQGYCSDLTRTMWFNGSNNAFREILEAVLEAQDAAIDVAGPGVEASQVDRAARAILEKRGLARYFIHGLGHGVGVEVHEKPYLRPGSKEVLEPGMVVTVEPGVYMPGVYGVRIEDMILITNRGARLLTSISRLLF